MAIYDFSKTEKNEFKTSSLPSNEIVEEEAFTEPKGADVREEKTCARGHLFSAIASRLFFFLLFVGDVLWVFYTLFLLFLSSVGKALTLNKASCFKRLSCRAWISLRRSLVCGLSLFVALFSPAFGIMIACTYFLMYDKSGIEEVVPSSLQAQFREFIPKE
jgi:hypothetical protein